MCFLLIFRYLLPLVDHSNKETCNELLEVEVQVKPTKMARSRTTVVKRMLPSEFYFNTVTIEE